MPTPSPKDINQATVKDWLLMAGLAVVLSVPMVGAVRLLDGDLSSSPQPNAATPGSTNTAGVTPLTPAGNISASAEAAVNKALAAVQAGVEDDD